MKIVINLLIIAFSALLLGGCAKTDSGTISVQDQNVQNLVGAGNRVWHLSKMYVMGVQQVLTDAQMKYTKTYTIDPSIAHAGSFTDSDGYNGIWKLSVDAYIRETILNNPVGPVPVDYEIIGLTANLLDVQYVANYKIVRQVYYAN